MTQDLRFFLDRALDRPLVTGIELLLIAAVVYTILRSLEGTRGARLVRAVLAILAVSFAVVWLIAERFAFERINALYPYFILGVFLASLVAFQTELRRLLMRLGEGGWLRRWVGRGEDILDPVVTAVERLAKKKIGALIAIERTTRAGAIAESGVELDAVLTTDLLETIFWPGSALHDLGVIVRGARIHAAGCQFPLTDSADVDRSLGSRHRAAIGMSHETDAVVVVVSEESGQVSLAVSGRLLRSLDRARLRKTLATELLVVGTKPPNAPTPSNRPQGGIASDELAGTQAKDGATRDAPKTGPNSQSTTTARLPHDGTGQAA